MAIRSAARLLAFVGSAALALILISGQESHAQKKVVKPPTKPHVPKAPENTVVKSKEAEVLRTAYILVAATNHNYKGYREKAMREIESAVKILDHSIFKKGSGAEKVLAVQEDITAGKAKFLQKLDAKVHEPQVVSDMQMQEAGTLLGQVRPVLVQGKQTGVLRHVDNALKDITTALQYSAVKNR